MLYFSFQKIQLVLVIPALVSFYCCQRFGRFFTDVTVEWLGCLLLGVLPAFVSSQCPPGTEGLITLGAEMGEAVNMGFHMATKAILGVIEFSTLHAGPHTVLLLDQGVDLILQLGIVPNGGVE